MMYQVYRGDLRTVLFVILNNNLPSLRVELSSTWQSNQTATSGTPRSDEALVILFADLLEFIGFFMSSLLFASTTKFNNIHFISSIYLVFFS